MDVGKVIAEEGAKEVKKKFEGSMVSMFLFLADPQLFADFGGWQLSPLDQVIYR